MHTFSHIKQLLQQGRTSCTTIVADCLRHIAQKKGLNAFVNVYGEKIRKHAQQLDQKIKEGKRGGPLAGMVVGLKDMISYQDHPLHAGSKILEGFIAQFNATATERLLNADAMIIGHQNCDQFGMGSSNENSCFGPVKHPLDPTRVPGGSSGGSAVAVQTNMCHVALGTDTGGSVRQPAAFCGIVGLKPSYGRISRHGVVAFASSLDTVGVFANNISDCAKVLETIAGQDEWDSTVAPHPVPPYSNSLAFNKKGKVAYLKETLTHQGLQKEIKAHTLATLNQLKKEEHQVDGIDCPELEYALPAYYILSTAEASTNLARFDGVRYGYRSKSATSLEEMYYKTRTEGFGQEVKKRIMLGTFVLSAAQYSHYYVKAQKVRRLIKSKMEAILSEYDFIVLPTTTTTAFKLNSPIKNKLEMYWSDYYTVPASVAGVPAISIPNGVDGEGLPIGLQIIANTFQEDKLLAFANYVTGLKSVYAKSN